MISPAMKAGTPANKVGPFISLPEVRYLVIAHLIRPSFLDILLVRRLQSAPIENGSVHGKRVQFPHGPAAVTGDNIRR